MSIWQKSYTQTCLIEGRGKACRFAALLLIFIACFLASLFFGSTRTGVLQAVSAAAAGDYDSAAYRIIAHVRLPRTLAAALAGGALAVSGVIIQAVLNNAMASPGIIGVNSGAGLAATLLIALSPAAVSALPWAAFLGALGACLLIYAVAERSGASRLTITLVGVTVSSILTAGINTVKTIFPDSLYNANSFLMGGVAGVSLSKLDPACWLIGAGIL